MALGVPPARGGGAALLARATKSLGVAVKVTAIHAQAAPHATSVCDDFRSLDFLIRPGLPYPPTSSKGRSAVRPQSRGLLMFANLIRQFPCEPALVPRCPRRPGTHGVGVTAGTRVPTKWVCGCGQRSPRFFDHCQSNQPIPLYLSPVPRCPRRRTDGGYPRSGCGQRSPTF